MDYISAAPFGDIAQAVQADLAAVGIKVSLQPGEQKQVITKTRARQHQLAMLVWGSDYFDPNSNAQAFCENPDDSDTSKLKILAWRRHFKDTDLTAQSAAAAKELDSKKRIAMYEDMQRKFMEQRAVRHAAAEERQRGRAQGHPGLRGRAAARLHAIRKHREELMRPRAQQEGNPTMLSRRTLLAASASTLAAPALLARPTPRRRRTPW